MLALATFAIVVWSAEIARAVCGDAILDVAEECDDGNTARGDCCLSDCRFDPVEAPCGSESLCDAARLGICDGSGTCVAEQPLCNILGIHGRWCGSKLSLRDASGTDGDRILVRNIPSRFGPTTLFVTPERIGDPTADTRYALCAYDDYWPDAASTILYDVTIQPSDAWRPVAQGWSLRDGDRNPLRRAALTEGRLRVVAQGTALALPGPVDGVQYFAPLPKFFFVSDAGLCTAIAHNLPSTNIPTRYDAKDRCLTD